MATVRVAVYIVLASVYLLEHRSMYTANCGTESSHL